MRNRDIAAGLAAALVLGAGLAAAQPLPLADVVAPEIPKFRVEFIVFAYTDADPEEEVFSARAPVGAPGIPVLREPRLPSGDGAAAAGPAPAAPGADAARDPFEFIDPFGQLAAATDTAPPFRFRVLRGDELELTEVYARIARLGAYQPLAHGAWIQEGLDERSARPLSLASLGIVNPVGTLRLHLSRFLHLGVDLEYRAAPAAVVGSAGADPAQLTELFVAPRFRMVEQRRARSGELHYVDHPLFGLLFMISPAPDEGEIIEGENSGAVPAA